MGGIAPSVLLPHPHPMLPSSAVCWGAGRMGLSRASLTLPSASLSRVAVLFFSRVGCGLALCAVGAHASRAHAPRPHVRPLQPSPSYPGCVHVYYWMCARLGPCSLGLARLAGWPRPPATWLSYSVGEGHGVYWGVLQPLGCPPTPACRRRVMALDDCAREQCGAGAGVLGCWGLVRCCSAAFPHPGYGRPQPPHRCSPGCMCVTLLSCAVSPPCSMPTCVRCPSSGDRVVGARTHGCCLSPALTHSLPVVE